MLWRAREKIGDAVAVETMTGRARIAEDCLACGHARIGWIERRCLLARPGQAFQVGRDCFQIFILEMRAGIFDFLGHWSSHGGLLIVSGFEQRGDVFGRHAGQAVRLVVCDIGSEPVLNLPALQGSGFIVGAKKVFGCMACPAVAGAGHEERAAIPIR